MKSHYVKRVVKVYRYRAKLRDEPQNRLIYSLKQHNREDVFDFLSDELIIPLSRVIDLNNKDKYIITNVPRRKKSIIYYGYDHAAVLAKCVAKKLGIKYISLLTSTSKKAQKEMVGYERVSNLKYTYKSRRSIDLTGKTVVIVDDIITTGSSMGTSAALIRAYGAKRFIGAAIAIAYKDEYIPLVRY